MAHYQNDVLNERETTHGDYSDVATVAQQIKSIFMHTRNWQRMPDHARESLEMKATKMARICCGDYTNVDHWEDIAGYAQLSAHRFDPHAQAAAAVASALAMPRMERSE